MMEELFALDPSSPSGLVWKVERFSGRNKCKKQIEIGQSAGCIDSRGYWVIRVNGKNHYAHRIIWYLVHKDWPKNHIDHIDGNPSNNTLANLRLCPNDGLDNNQNLKKSKANKSGFTGVHWAKKTQKWQAQIKVNNKMLWLGYYDSAEEGYNAYLEAKARYHTFNPIPRY